MNKFATVAAALVSAAMFGLAAIAADDDGAVGFDIADGNKDNMVSFDEARGIFPTLEQAIFDMADADDDGFLTEGEYTQLNGLIDRDETPSDVSSSVSSESSISSIDISIL